MVMSLQRRRVGQLSSDYYGDVLMIEYHDGVPRNVATTDGGYDFGQSKEHGMLFHCHGSSSCYLSRFVGASARTKPLAAVWIADGAKVTDAGSLSGKALTKEEIRAFGYRILRAPKGDPFDGARECDGHIEWCCICEDYMPDDSECLCQHLFEADDLGTTGPGAYDIVNDGAEGDFMLPVVELAVRAGVARTWRRSILSNENARRRTMSAVGGLGPTFVYATMNGRQIGGLVRDAAEEMSKHDFDAAQRAANWFMALDEKTTKANAATAEWLGLVVQAQNARRRSGAPVYAVRVDGRYETDEEGASPRWTGSTEKDKAHGTWWTTELRLAAHRPWSASLTRAKELRGQRVDAKIVFARRVGAK